MKRLKRTVMVLLGCLMAFAAAACAKAEPLPPLLNGTGLLNEEQNTPDGGPDTVDPGSPDTGAVSLEGLPVFENGRRFDLMAWGVPAGRPQLQDYKDCGMNWLMLSLFDYHYRYPDPTACEAAIKDTLDICDELGLSVFVELHNGWQQRGNGAQLGGSVTPTYFWDTIEESITFDYTAYPAFKGIFVFDEPGGGYGTSKPAFNDFDFLAGQVAQYENLWAGDDPLFKTGTPDDYYFFNNMAGGDVGSTGLIPMRDKVYPLLPDDKVIVSCDQYALYYDAVNDVPQIRSGWLRVTGSWAELSRDKGYDFWTFVLGGVSPYYGSPDGGGRGDGKGNLSVEDFRFQDWVQLAFGSMGIEYFVYASNSEFNGPVDGFGAKKPGYYAIQTVHAELQALAPVYFDFDWQGALTVLGGKNKLGYNDSFDEMGGIAAPASRGRLAASSADRDTLIGVFKHPDGHDGYAVVNYSDPYFHKTDNVTLRFTDAARAMIWKRGVREVVNLSSNGSLTLELPYGEGVFVVPAA